MMIKKLLLVSLASIFSTAVYASPDWAEAGAVKIIGTTNELRVFVDINSISRVGNIVAYFEKGIFSEVDAAKYDGVRAILFSRETSCSSKNTRTLVVTTHSDYQLIGILSRQDTPNSKFSPNTRGSMEDIINIAVCKITAPGRKINKRLTV